MDNQEQQRIEIANMFEWLKGAIYGIMSMALPEDHKSFISISLLFNKLQDKINGVTLEDKPSKQLNKLHIDEIMYDFTNSTKTAIYYGKILREEKDETFLENIGLPERMLELEGLYEELTGGLPGMSKGDKQNA